MTTTLSTHDQSLREKVTTTVASRDVQKRIVEELHRRAELDASRIHVTAEESRVILTGIVHSFFEKDEAGRAAWAGPGIAFVENLIAVVPCQPGSRSSSSSGSSRL